MKEENERLRARIAELEEFVGVTAAKVPISFALGHRQSQLFGLLLSRPLVPKEAAMSVIYGDGDWPEGTIIEAMIHHLRRKLKPFGIEIKTVVGGGYYVSATMKDRVRKFLELEKQP